MQTSDKYQIQDYDDSGEGGQEGWVGPRILRTSSISILFCSQAGKNTQLFIVLLFECLKYLIVF